MQKEGMLFDYKSFLKKVPNESGVYLMHNSAGKVIYVGKAKNLKKRLSSYFNKNQGAKTSALVQNIAEILYTITQTETEALLLENNYIKEYQPKYNILFRDDKSFPYLQISKDKHPRISLYRGIRKSGNDYFGPYPSVGAVKETLNLLTKLFLVRQCENSFYRNRSRPCLQYQIKRCLAPCVSGFVSDEEYLVHVNYVRLFLSGKDKNVIELLIAEMEKASKNLDFENAAKIRNTIQSIRTINEKQAIEHNLENMDLIGSAYENGKACIFLLFIRQGKIIGNRAFFPKIPEESSRENIIRSFIEQYYLYSQIFYGIPNSILVDFPIENYKNLAQNLSDLLERKVKIDINANQQKAKASQMATKNAQQMLKIKFDKNAFFATQFEKIQQFFNLEKLTRIECFDISHFMGKQTFASCVVFDKNGALKSEFRQLKISGINEGDDYAAMEQAVYRRYLKLIDHENMPELIFIDGGKGQLSRVLQTFERLFEELEPKQKKPLIVSIAKGTERKEGLETFFVDPKNEGFFLQDLDLLRAIQQIRNASHSHALSAHQKKREKDATSSSLEEIPGIGTKRRQNLLKYLGGFQGVKQATIEQLEEIPGISKNLAKKIHKALKE